MNETSFEVGKGKDGSLHMLNPCMNLVYKTTLIALLFTKQIDRCQLEYRLANTIMFNRLPFQYASNVFKGKRAGSSNIPLPDCLNVDKDDEDARRKFMELLQQWNQLVVLVINHFNSKGGNGGSASSAASFFRLRLQLPLPKTGGARQSLSTELGLAGPSKTTHFFLKMCWSTNAVIHILFSNNWQHLK